LRFRVEIDNPSHEHAGAAQTGLWARGEDNFRQIESHPAAARSLSGMNPQELFFGAAMAAALGLAATAVAKPPPKNSRKTERRLPRTPPKGMYTAGKVPSQNHAYLLGHGGTIDTDIQLDDFVHEDHTVSLWVMLQYPHGFTGPLVAENGSGAFVIGQLDYREGAYDKDAALAGNPMMYVRVGNKTAYYEVPEAKTPQWVHVAVVRQAGTFRMIINGKPRAPYAKSGVAKNVSVPANYTAKPHGTLRLGRRTDGAATTSQAYGYVDDVAIFRKALRPKQLVALAKTKRLTGTEADLWKGMGFDKPLGETPLPFKLQTPIQPSPHTAKQLPVSKTRSSSDRAAWDSPFTLMAMYPYPIQLPFNKDEIWEVTQGMNDPVISHNGPSPFSIDLVRVPLSDTAGTQVVAVGPGRVIRYRDSDNPTVKQESNKIHFDVGSDLVMTYQHFEFEGLAPSIKGGTWNSTFDMMSLKPGEQVHFDAGEELGEIGDIANHLHIASSRTGKGSVPYPYADFEVSTDSGVTWTPVIRGIPRKGMWVRRTVDVKFPKKKNLVKLPGKHLKVPIRRAQ